MSSLVLQIQSKLEEYQSLLNVKSHLASVKEQLSAKYSELKSVTKQLHKEEKELDDLQNSGLKNLFYKVLGDKEKQIEIERQELLAVSLKYNALKEGIELLEFELEVLEKKVLNIDSVKREITQLKKARELEITTGPNSSLKSEYLLLIKKYETNVMLHKEIEEAIDAGQISHKALHKLGTLLTEALNWGRWPNQGRGGYHTMMKRSKMANATRMVADIQRRLDNFGREMEDLGEKNMYFRLRREDFANFTNFFFDNLITDWIIQKKIKNSLSNLEMIIDRIARVVGSLEQELHRVKSVKESLLKEKDGLLMS